MVYDDDFLESDDYELERPRDEKIDDAKTVLRADLFAGNQDSVFYQRQIEIKYESTFFHWITAKALGELVAEGHLSSELTELSGPTRIRFYWRPRNRYWKRQANAIKKLVLKFSDSSMSRAIGRQGEVMFDASLPRIGFLPVSPFKNVRTFASRTWTESRHDLDRVFACDGINYGIEIKNTLSYIERSELETKLDMCAHLELRPLFIMRMAPKSYMYEIQKRGGFGLLFGSQLYPFGANDLAREVRQNLNLPVECVAEVADGHLQRLRRWHDGLVRRLAAAPNS